MAKKQTKKPTLDAILKRSSILKKENDVLRRSLDVKIADYQKQFEIQKKAISGLRDLVDKREAEIMAMNQNDASLYKRIESLEAEIKLNKLVDDGTEQRIERLEQELATAKSTLKSEREQLREQLQSVRIQNERLSQMHASSLEFIRTHCFEGDIS